ncbi:MAG: hypothetical protein IBX67_01680, partial [Dehalococcoidia bacterium]|nr:hypothetical protein [Dehalococcoidia bacterium]
HTNLATATGTPPTGPNVTGTDSLTVTFAECVLVCGFVYEYGTMQPLPGWEVIIEKQGSPWVYVGSAFTDENGKYCFPLCEDGVYRITEVVQPGWSLVSPVPNEHIWRVPEDGSSDPVTGPFLDFLNERTPTITVGWQASSVDKLAVVRPWVALLIAIIAGPGLLVLRRRQLQARR